MHYNIKHIAFCTIYGYMSDCVYAIFQPIIIVDVISRLAQTDI